MTTVHVRGPSLIAVGSPPGIAHGSAEALLPKNFAPAADKPAVGKIAWNIAEMGRFMRKFPSGLVGPSDGMRKLLRFLRDLPGVLRGLPEILGKLPEIPL